MYNKTYYRWSPSKTAKREFAEKMEEVEAFCREHGISASRTNDSYYFTLNGQGYRVSNHSVESSPYHNGRDADTIYIHAGKTRIIEIYTNLAKGYALDGRGNIK